MADFTPKVDGNTVGAGEWNQLADLDNLTSSAGLTPSTSNLYQMAISSARYSSAGNYFTDLGTANAYVLSSVASFSSPVSATAGEGYFVGMRIRFRAGNNNTGASTVNVNSAGVKNLVLEDGTTTLPAGIISTTADSEFRYDGTAFRIVRENLATSTIRGIAYLPKLPSVTNNISNPSTDIVFGSYVMQFSDGSGQALQVAKNKKANLTWASGSDAGGMANGVSFVASTTYFMFALAKADGSLVDFGFDTSASASNLIASPAVTAYFGGTPKWEYIASFRTNASTQIRGGSYIFSSGAGKYFFNASNVVTDVSLSNPATGIYTSSLTVPVGRNIMVRGVAIANTGTTSTDILRINYGGLDDLVGNGGTTVDLYSIGSANRYARGYKIFLTTTGQIQYNIVESTGAREFIFITQGWWEI